MDYTRRFSIVDIGRTHYLATDEGEGRNNGKDLCAAPKRVPCGLARGHVALGDPAGSIFRRMHQVDDSGGFESHSALFGSAARGECLPAARVYRHLVLWYRWDWSGDQ